MTFSWPLYWVATSSTTGASARHGPHHAAPKSTSTGPSTESTSSSKLSSSTSITFGLLAMMTSFHLDVPRPLLLTGRAPAEDRAQAAGHSTPVYWDGETAGRPL